VFHGMGERGMTHTPDTRVVGWSKETRNGIPPPSRPVGGGINCGPISKIYRVRLLSGVPPPLDPHCALAPVGSLLGTSAVPFAGGLALGRRGRAAGSGRRRGATHH